MSAGGVAAGRHSARTGPPTVGGILNDTISPAPRHQLPPERLLIRRLWPRDEGIFRDHLRRLDPRSRRARFGGAVGGDFLDRYAGAALSLEGLIYGGFVDGKLRAAGELRSLGDVRPRSAEAAFSVEHAYQDSGVGTALMGRVITAARNRGFRTIYMLCLADNGRMRRLAQKHGADLQLEGESVAGTITQTGPTPVSLLEEMVHDAQGFVTAVLRWPAGGERP